MTAPAGQGSLRVLVGFTGGLRSAILASLLREQGHEVMGVYLDFSDFWQPASTEEGLQPQDPWLHSFRGLADPGALAAAVRQAENLHLDLQVIQAGGLFDQRVADPILHAAISRRDESPEVLFHSELLVPALARLAREGGFDRWASGHSVLQEGDSLLEGAPAGDQLRLVGFAPQDDLSNGLFPLGMFQDSHLEKLGSQLGLEFRQPSKREAWHSSGAHPAIVVPDLWGEWSTRRLPPELCMPGWIRYKANNAGLTEHRGLHRHPVGLPLRLPKRGTAEATAEESESSWYSMDVELSSQTVWALSPAEFPRSSAALQDLHWLEREASPTGVRVRALVCGGSGLPGEASGVLHFHSLSTGRIDFTAPAELLFYGTRLLLLKDRRVVGHTRISSHPQMLQRPEGSP
jgi:tRNA U34 2-thiouridine synthase MnmA/TrmU